MALRKAYYLSVASNFCGFVIFGNLRTRRPAAFPSLEVNGSPVLLNRSRLPGIQRSVKAVQATGNSEESF